MIDLDNMKGCNKMDVKKLLLVTGLLVIFFMASQADSGQDTKSVEYSEKGPYVVAVWIKYANKQNKRPFAGALVRDKWVVLAAPNITLIDTRNTYVAMWNFSWICSADEIFTPPNYNKRGSHNDIMLIKLISCFGKGKKNLKPVEINADPNCPVVKQTVTLTGWKDNMTFDFTNGLYKEYLTVLDTGRSLDQLNTKEKDMEVSINSPLDKITTIIASGKSKSLGPCNGYQEGPLVAKCGNSQVPVGLLSRDYDCEHPEGPGVFTRLSDLKEWMDDTICKNSNGCTIDA